MEQRLLIADADSYLSDLYLKYFGAHGYSVRVASGGVECLTALRETTPDVLVLDTELKWGGADGVLAVMDEEDDLSTIPIVLLNDKPLLAARVIDRLHKPFYFQKLLDSIGTAAGRPMQPR